MYFPSKFGCCPDKPKKKKKFKPRNRTERRSRNLLNLSKRRKTSLTKRIRKIKRKPINLHRSRFKNKIVDVGAVLKKDVTLMNAPETKLTLQEISLTSCMSRMYGKKKCRTLTLNKKTRSSI